MNLESILLDGLWSALFATAMSIRNSTPFKYIIFTNKKSRQRTKGDGKMKKWRHAAWIFLIIFLPTAGWSADEPTGVKPDIAALLQFAGDDGKYRINRRLRVTLRNLRGIGDSGHQFVLVHKVSLP